MNRNRITFYMDNGTTIPVEVSNADRQTFDAALMSGLHTMQFENQKGGRLGEKIEIGITLAHVVSFAVQKL
jgi:hypothetical protein